MTNGQLEISVEPVGLDDAAELAPLFDAYRAFMVSVPI